MENIFQNYISKAKDYKAQIAYNELSDPRVRCAVYQLKEQGFDPVLVGKQKELVDIYGDDLSKFKYYIHDSDESLLDYTSQLVLQGKVDGMISGAMRPTSEVLKSVIAYIDTKDGVDKISGYFLINTDRGLILTADCAVQPSPSVDELADIAYLSAHSALSLGIMPKIAMLSFSSKGSADYPMAQKVRKASSLAKQKFDNEDMDVDIQGELQLDTAISPAVASQKLPDGVWGGDANVLVFPDLNAGNIGYKLIEQFGNSQAIGPILQGLTKPCNDLSRGCSMEDILVLHAITVLQAKEVGL